MKYKRDINEDFLQLFLKEEPLNFLLNYDDLDFQLRSNKGNPHGWISLYIGLTKILDVFYSITQHAVRFDAHKTYKKTESSLFSKRWFKSNELFDIKNVFENYKNKVMVAERHSNKEGKVQQALSIKLGRKYNNEGVCVLIDREVSLRYNDTPEKKREFESIQNDFKRIAQDISKSDPKSYGKKLSEKSFGGKLDSLGVGTENELFLIEVKPHNEAMGIYHSPLQVGVYTKAWMKLKDQYEDETIEHINRLIEQKERLGLVPATSIRLKKGFKIIPCLIIGEKTPEFKESKVVYDRLRNVLDIVNEQHDDCLKNFQVFELNGEKIKLKD